MLAVIGRPDAVDAARAGGGGDVGAEEHACDERVQHAREQQRPDVEDHQVGHVVRDVVASLHLERARLDARAVGEHLRPRRREREPRCAVEGAEGPHGGDDALRSLHRAHGVRAHRPADGDVPFGREGRDGHRRHVDAEVLREDHHGAADGAEHALVDDQEVLDDRRQRRRHQQQHVGDRQRHEVAVGRRVHTARAPHDDDDHDVADEADDEDEADEETSDDAVGQGVVGGVGQVRRVPADDGRVKRHLHGRHRCRDNVTSGHDVGTEQVAV